VLLSRKLPRTSFALLALSLACAGGAGLAMQAYARRLDAERPDGGPPLTVVAAARDIARGSIVADAALTTVTIPTRFAPPGSVRDPARAAGRVALADVAAGEILTRPRLAGGAAGRVAALVPAGMRAVELPVASTVGAEPGDLVDVLATFGGGGTHTEVAGEALEVLSIEGRAGGGALAAGATPAQRGLVVLVEPDEAERLAFAAAFATLSIAVLGPADAATPEPVPVPTTVPG
jgi:pilus assembly protein CpaB